MTENLIDNQTQAKIFVNPKDLVSALAPLRQARRIVLVKGAYDLFHVGHYYSFVNAKCLGDLLVVAVNSDEGISARKDPARPILPLHDRMVLIAALACVDFTTVYNGASPFEIIRQLSPDVFAASHFQFLSDAQRSLLEKNTAFHIVPKMGGTSTSEIIRKIKGLANA